MIIKYFSGWKAGRVNFGILIIWNIQQIITFKMYSPQKIIGQFCNYRKTSKISRTLLCNNIVDHSDVFGASPVGAAPTTSSFLT